MWGEAKVTVSRGDAAPATRVVRGMYDQLRTAIREWAEELKAV